MRVLGLGGRLQGRKVLQLRREGNGAIRWRLKQFAFARPLPHGLGDGFGMEGAEEKILLTMLAAVGEGKDKG